MIIHSNKRIAIATGTILAVGVIHLLSWRLDAQEPTAPIIGTKRIADLDAQALEAKASSSESGGFGPVVERVIATADADEQGLVFFDMETGKSFKPPFPLTFRPNQLPFFVELTPELKQWIKARDVDVLLRLGEKTWKLMTLEMQEAFAGQLNEWETISPEKVIGIFAAKDAEHLVRDEVPASRSVQSYRDGFSSFDAFRTRSNTIGVYQFEGVDNSTRRGVRLRYRLMQGTDSASAISPKVGETAKTARDAAEYNPRDPAVNAGASQRPAISRVILIVFAFAVLLGAAIAVKLFYFRGDKHAA